MVVLFAIAFVVIKKRCGAAGCWPRATTAGGGAGHPAKRCIAAYVISAVLSGIAGIMLTLDLGLGLPETGVAGSFAPSPLRGGRREPQRRQMFAIGI